MAEGNVSIRFSVEDEETVRAALEKLGRDGEAALRRLDAASKAGQPGLTALDKVMAGLKDRVVGVALSIGPAGQVLVALGPAGVAAAAGIGALISVLGKVNEAAHKLSDDAARIRDFAETAGISTDQVQALIEAGARLGRSPEQVQTFVEKFSTQVEQLKRGTGELLDQISRVDPELAKQVASAKTVAEAWDLVAKAYKAADDAGNTLTRNAIARAIGGQRGGLAAGGLLGQSANAGGLDNLTNSVREAGAMIDRELNQKLAILRREIDQINSDASRVFASIFSETVLENEKRFAESWLEIAKAAREFSLSPSLEKLLEFFGRGLGALQSDDQRNVLKFGKQFKAEQEIARLQALKADLGKRIINEDDPRQVQMLAAWLEKVNKELAVLEQGGRPHIVITKSVDNNIPLPRARPSGQMLGTPSAEFLLSEPGGLRARAAVLGSAITPTEQLTLKTTELNAAIERNSELSGFAARGLAAFKLAQEQTAVATRTRLGIVGEEELANLRAGQLDKDHADGFIRKAADRAQAERLVAKEIKATIEQQAIRAAQFPGLKGMELAAGDLNKQLDQLGTGLTSEISSGLTDITLSSDGAAAGFKRLEQQLARTALQMVINATVGRLMSTIFQGFFGSILPGGGGMGIPGIDGLGRNAAGTDDWRGGWTTVGENGMELLRAPRGTQIVPNHRLSQPGASPSMVPAQIGPSVVVNNYGNDKAEATSRRGPDGREIVEVIIGEVKNRWGRGEFDSVGSARHGLSRNVVKR